MADKISRMVAHSRGRTGASLERLQGEMDRVRQNVLSGELDGAFRRLGEDAIPSALQISLSAGNNKWFLYGEKHRDSTLPTVEGFREEMIGILVNRCRSPRKILNSRDAISELIEKNQKLGDHAHVWFLRMRSMRKELNELKRRVPLKVVPIRKRSDESPS